MKRRSYTRWFAALMGLVVFLFSGAAPAAEVRVMISAGFFEVYKELAPVFERTSGHRLITTRGPSMGDSPEAIPTRIKRGDPVDVVIMIGESIDELGRQGLVSPGSKVDLARSQIGMVVRAGAAKPDIGSVEAFRRTLLEAKSIAYLGLPAAFIFRRHSLGSSALRTRSVARVARSRGHRPANRWQRSSREARRKSDFSR